MSERVTIPIPLELLVRLLELFQEMREQLPEGAPCSDPTVMEELEQEVARFERRWVRTP